MSVCECACVCAVQGEEGRPSCTARRARALCVAVLPGLSLPSSPPTSSYVSVRCCLLTSPGSLNPASAIPYSFLAFLLCSQRPSSPCWCSHPCSGSIESYLGHGLGFDGLWTSALQVMPPLTELPNEFFKIKPFLPPHGVSTPPFVVCPALESSFICPTLRSLHQRGRWRCHLYPHCCLTPALPEQSLLPSCLAPPTLPSAQVLPRLSLWLRGQQPTPPWHPSGLGRCEALCVLPAAGQSRALLQGGIWRLPESDGGIHGPLAALPSRLWLALLLQRRVPKETN